MAKAWRKPEDSYIKPLMQKRVILWRKQPAINRIDRPTRIEKARKLGYKAKKGYVIVRIRTRRSSLRKKRPKMGRRQKRMGVNKYKPAKNMKLISEERVAKRFPNLEVLNSYWVWQDGQHKWFEIILVDTKILANINIQKHRGRVFRGLTSSGRKVRGLMT